MHRNRTASLRLATMTAVIMLLVILSVLDSRARAQSNAWPEPEALVELLRAGGYSLYFRHEATDWSQYDDIRREGDWLSCDGSRVRQLSDAGRKRAIATGEAIRSLGIPLGKVLASPYCRTVETARLMNLGAVEATSEIVNLRVASYFGGRAAIVETARALLATAPASGTNTLLVAHGNVAREATPVYPDEGEGVVFQADGAGGFRVIGRIGPEHWQRVANSAQ